MAFSPPDGHAYPMATTEQLGGQIASPSHHRGRERARRLDGESQAWIDRLGPDSADRATAIDELHALLLKATRFELNRRRPALSHLGDNDYNDLAHQRADDALVAVLSKLANFRGESRFTTWAYKFALLEAGVKLRMTVDDVPIDVLAERFETTRGALYKTIHDARRKLCAALVADGLSVGDYMAATSS
jgi:hypothetical protein